MNPQVEQVLQALLRQHGQELLGDTRRLEGLLRDRCPRDKRDVFALVGALKARVPQELQSTGSRLPWEVIESRLVKKMLDDMPLSDEVARDSVLAWARALGFAPAPGSGSIPAPASPAWHWHSGQTARDFDEWRAQAGRPENRSQAEEALRQGHLRDWLTSIGDHPNARTVSHGLTLPVLLNEPIPASPAAPPPSRQPAPAHRTPDPVPAASTAPPPGFAAVTSVQQPLAPVSAASASPGETFSEKLGKVGRWMGEGWEVGGSMGGFSAVAILLLCTWISGKWEWTAVICGGFALACGGGIAGGLLGSFFAGLHALFSSRRDFSAVPTVVCLLLIAIPAGGGCAWLTREGRINPRFPDINVPFLSQSEESRLVSQGKAAFDRGDHKAAIEAFSKALEKAPDNQAALFGRGRARFRLKQYAEAEQDFARCSTLVPNDSSAHSHRGLCLARMNRHEDALAAFTRALASKADATDFVGRSRVYNTLNRHDDAISDATKALELEPANSSAYFERAYARGAKNEIKQAIDDYTSSLRHNPRESAAYHNRGNLHKRNKDYQQAVNDYTEAIRLDPSYAESHRALASALRALGKVGEAAKFDRRADEIEGKKAKP